jgi:lipid-A-disaccharide synthase
MGFAEVLLNLRTILKNISLAKKDILDYNPDVLILVDYPGFNLRMAKFAHEQGLKVFYYISPQIWAWKKGRVKTIRKYVDRMFVILPFEKEFYKNYQVDVDFVGHPLLDSIENERKKLKSNQDFRKQYKLDDRPIISLLPGSRKQEIGKMLEVMLSIVPDYPEFQFVIAGAPSMPEEFYRSTIGNTGVKLIFDATHDLLDKSHAALVTSGTATLETALMNVPEVVCYKGSKLSYQIAKRLVHIKYISLVNLIMDRKIVEELIQHEMNTTRLKQEFDRILEAKNRKRIFEDYKALKEKLGGTGASQTTARLMTDYLNASLIAD